MTVESLALSAVLIALVIAKIGLLALDYAPRVLARRRPMAERWVRGPSAHAEPGC